MIAGYLHSPLRDYAYFLCVPISDILNKSLISGQWPKIYKTETITPAPKQYPPENCEMLRPIANLFNIDQIMEKIIAEMVIADMKAKLDPKQFGNQKNLGIQHYLVRLLQRILSSVDNNKNGEITAVLCLFVDWKQAFSRQCHTLGVESFKKNGVRASLLPLLSNYLQGRQMRVKWRGKLSEIRNLPGGGAMGATLGIWEYLSQTNNNADCVPVEDRFKFVDDLTVLEVINLVNMTIQSYDVTNHVPSDISTNNQYIDGTQLKSQKYLDEIDQWSTNQKMVISQPKTKAMIINFTRNYQFNTRLKLKNENIEMVSKMKILGTIVNDKLTWDENCAQLIKKVNSRMVLIRTAKEFGATVKESVHLWIVFCRSLLEQSCTVWHSNLTQENFEDLERTQKTFAKLVLGQKYKNYEDALIKLNLHPLNERRENLCFNFAKSGIRNSTLTDLLPRNTKDHIMNTRKFETHNVDFTNTERYGRSSVPYMQRLLNHSN